eukprot:9500506-Pyramimonas_sp.AAC.1
MLAGPKGRAVGENGELETGKSYCRTIHDDDSRVRNWWFYGAPSLNNLAACSLCVSDLSTSPNSLKRFTHLGEAWNVEECPDHQEGVVGESEVPGVGHQHVVHVIVLHVGQAPVHHGKLASNADGVEHDKTGVPEPLNRSGHKPQRLLWKAISRSGRKGAAILATLGCIKRGFKCIRKERGGGARNHLAGVEAVADNLAEGPRDDHRARVEEDPGRHGPSRRRILRLAAKRSHISTRHTQRILSVPENLRRASG